MKINFADNPTCSRSYLTGKGRTPNVAQAALLRGQVFNFEGGHMVNNIVPKLPAGCQVCKRPDGLESVGRRQGKYDFIVESLKVIDATMCVEMSTLNKTPAEINVIKLGIRYAAHKLQFKPRIKYTLKDDVLYIWCNR